MRFMKVLKAAENEHDFVADKVLRIEWRLFVDNPGLSRKRSDRQGKEEKEREPPSGFMQEGLKPIGSPVMRIHISNPARTKRTGQA